LNRHKIVWSMGLLAGVLLFASGELQGAIAVPVRLPVAVALNGPARTRVVRVPRAALVDARDRPWVRRVTIPGPGVVAIPVDRALMVAAADLGSQAHFVGDDGSIRAIRQIWTGPAADRDHEDRPIGLRVPLHPSGDGTLEPADPINLPSGAILSVEADDPIPLGSRWGLVEANASGAEWGGTRLTLRADTSPNRESDRIPLERSPVAPGWRIHPRNDSPPPSHLLVRWSAHSWALDTDVDGWLFFGTPSGQRAKPLRPEEEAEARAVAAAGPFLGDVGTLSLGPPAHASHFPAPPASGAEWAGRCRGFEIRPIADGELTLRLPHPTGEFVATQRRPAQAVGLSRQPERMMAGIRGAIVEVSVDPEAAWGGLREALADGLVCDHAAAALPAAPDVELEVGPDLVLLRQSAAWTLHDRFHARAWSLSDRGLSVAVDAILPALGPQLPGPRTQPCPDSQPLGEAARIHLERVRPMNLGHNTLNALVRADGRYQAWRSGWLGGQAEWEGELDPGLLSGWPDRLEPAHCGSPPPPFDRVLTQGRVGIAVASERGELARAWKSDQPGSPWLLRLPQRSGWQDRPGLDEAFAALLSAIEGDAPPVAEVSKRRPTPDLTEAFPHEAADGAEVLLLPPFLQHSVRGARHLVRFDGATPGGRVVLPLPAHDDAFRQTATVFTDNGTQLVATAEAGSGPEARVTFQAGSAAGWVVLGNDRSPRGSLRPGGASFDRSRKPLPPAEPAELVVKGPWWHPAASRSPRRGADGAIEPPPPLPPRLPPAYRSWLTAILDSPRECAGLPDLPIVRLSLEGRRPGHWERRSDGEFAYRGSDSGPGTGRRLPVESVVALAETLAEGQCWPDLFEAPALGHWASPQRTLQIELQGGSLYELELSSPRSVLLRGEGRLVRFADGEARDVTRALDALTGPWERYR